MASLSTTRSSGATPYKRTRTSWKPSNEGELFSENTVEHGHVTVDLSIQQSITCSHLSDALIHSDYH